MKRFLSAGVVLAAMLGLAGGAAAQTKLELSVFHSDKDLFGETLRWWADEVKKRTEGRILIVPVYNGALAKATETLDAVRDNAVPMGMTVASFMSGEIPGFAYLEMLGGLAADQEKLADATVAAWPAVAALLEAKEVIPLWAQVAVDTGIICKNQHLKGAADWKGKKIRASGRWQSKHVAAMGAAPVTIDTGEMYLALQSGTVECALTNPAGIKGLRLYEIAPYYTNMAVTSNMAVYVVNEGVWSKLPEADRTIIEAVSAEATQRGAQTMLGGTHKELKILIEGGLKVHDATPEEKKVFLDASRPIFEEIAGSAGEKGAKLRESIAKFH